MDGDNGQIRTALRTLKVFRFALLSMGISCVVGAAILVAQQVNAGNVQNAVIIGVAGGLFALIFGPGAWLLIGRFMRSASANFEQVRPQLQKLEQQRLEQESPVTTPQGAGSEQQEHLGTGLPVWLHLTLTAVGTLGVFVAFGVYWLFFNPDPLLLFAMPVVMFIAEQILERYVPARCPKCGRRLSCRILSRPVHHPQPDRDVSKRFDEARVSTYACLHCSYQFPQHVPDDWR